MSKHMYSTVNLSDNELREQGNRLFNVRKYDEAINCYSKAIIKNPEIAQYFTNRALCYLKLYKWELACTDCRRALELDSTVVKGHFFLGQALLELDLYDEAIKHLQRAGHLALEQKLNYGDDIASLLRTARKKRFAQQEEKRITQEIELLTYLQHLISVDKKRQMVDIENDSQLDDVSRVERLQAVEERTETYANELNTLFGRMDERRRKREVPDHLCGKISFEILQDPVITPSGITYDRKDLVEHLQRVGHFDPITRVKLTQDQLIPNFAMKEVVDAFLADNEWALDY